MTVEQSHPGDIDRRVSAFVRASVNGDNAAAARLLAEDPQIAGDIRAALVLGDVVRVRDVIADEPGMVHRRDPASGWTPLLAVCSSRWHQIDPGRADGLLALARLLLDAGADPNTSTPDVSPGNPRYCSTLFAASGCANHPALTELLLDRGARPDDHTVYLTAFHPDHACLRLLLDHGPVPPASTALAAPISTGDAEAVRLLLAAGAHPNQPLPADLVVESAPSGQQVTPLAAAIEAGCSAELVAALLDNGADPSTPDRAGRSPWRQAVRPARLDVAALLEQRGVVDDTVPADRLLCACLLADRGQAEQIVRDDAGLLERLGADDHAALVRASGRRLDAVRLMLDLGFPTQARGGADGATALHAAAGSGAADVVDLLIRRGADVEAPDTSWHATPLVWASVGSGIEMGGAPDPDWVAAARLLIDAGASVDGSWVDEKPPSPQVALVLRESGAQPPS